MRCMKTCATNGVCREKRGKKAWDKRKIMWYTYSASDKCFSRNSKYTRILNEIDAGKHAFSLCAFADFRLFDLLKNIQVDFRFFSLAFRFQNWKLVREFCAFVMRTQSHPFACHNYTRNIIWDFFNRYHFLSLSLPLLIAVLWFVCHLSSGSQRIPID